MIIKAEHQWPINVLRMALMKSHCRTLQQRTPEIAFVIDRLTRGERGGLQGVFEGIKRI